MQARLVVGFRSWHKPRRLIISNKTLITIISHFMTLRWVLNHPWCQLSKNLRDSMRFRCTTLRHHCLFSCVVIVRWILVMIDVQSLASALLRRQKWWWRWCFKTICDSSLKLVTHIRSASCAAFKTKRCFKDKSVKDLKAKSNTLRKSGNLLARHAVTGWETNKCSH